MKKNCDMDEAGELSILKELSDRDLLTGLLRQTVFEQKTKDILKNKGKGTLLILSIPGLPYFNRTDGFRNGDRIFQEAGGILLMEFCEDEITGRLENGDMIVFLPSVTCGSALMARLEALSDRFRKAGERLKLSAPLILSYGAADHSGSYEDMFSEAKDALRISKGRAEESLGLPAGDGDPVDTDRKLLAKVIEGDPIPMVTSYHSFTESAKLMKKVLSGTGRKMNLILITMTDQEGKMLSFTRRLSAMRAMRSSLMVLMNPGETAADYSSCQYVLMLLTGDDKEMDDRLEVLREEFENVFSDGKDMKISMDKIL